MSAQLTKEHLEREQKEKEEHLEREQKEQKKNGEENKSTASHDIVKNKEQSEGKDRSLKNRKKNVVILGDIGTDEEDQSLSKMLSQQNTHNEQDIEAIDENDVVDTNNTAFDEEYETKEEDM